MKKLPALGLLAAGFAAVGLWDRYARHQALARREAALRHPSMRMGQGAYYWAPCGTVLVAENPVTLAFDWIDHAGSCPSERHRAGEAAA